MNLTLRKIKNTGFTSLYKNFLLKDKFSVNDYEKLLSIAIIFLNSEDYNIQRLGYRIVVIYTNRTNDYAPLYEIAINKGLYPIVKFIDEHYLKEENRNVFTELNSSYLEMFRFGKVYFSEQQYLLNCFYSKNNSESISIVAPTSYGKTELILHTLNECKNKNICIITPTKSLLSQTRKRILDAKIEWINKVVVHPDMYNQNDNYCVAVLTQERLLRLLKNNTDIFFDYVIIDEAHNILQSNQRDEMLASTIVILNKRNKNTAFKFLTPFITDSNNLKVRYTSYDLSTYTINEYVKTEKIYLYDIRSNTGLSLYDQYTNEWISCENESKEQTSIQFIKSHSADKNIIYFNKPVDIEKYAKEMIANIPDVKQSKKLKKAIEHISNYISPEYTLVKCLKKGIIYHHGSVPDVIRTYIEYLYTNLPEIKYVITSSTLLEGINIPATKLFIMDNRKGKRNLTSSAFKNLIGRVCRFSEIFDYKNGSLNKLEPEIYLLFDKYFKKGANVKGFVSSVMKVDRDIRDKTENVLLCNTPITEENNDEFNRAKEFLENYEQGTVENYSNRHAETLIGKACILNNISELDVISCEEKLNKAICNYKKYNQNITNSDDLLDVICEVFLPYVIPNIENSNLLRFQNAPAKNYYKMFLAWKLKGLPYSQMIKLIVNYWRSLIAQRKDTIVYVGKWGEISRENSNRKNLTDIRGKDLSQLINLAIVRIKEEQDFIDNTIMKYVETLNDIGLIDMELYTKLKYGTNNSLEIVLIKNGISLSLTRLIMEKYQEDICVDIDTDTIKFQEELIEKMVENNENQILIFEAYNNIF